MMTADSLKGAPPLMITSLRIAHPGADAELFDVWDLSDSAIAERIAAYQAAQPELGEDEAAASARGDYITAAVAQLGGSEPWYALDGWDVSLLDGSLPDPQRAAWVAQATMHETLPAVPPVAP